MTPDDLRRMDNDLCIIFEKGIKPVKANKYYYFKHKKIVNDLSKNAISHNDIGEIVKGKWRKFNPYNPWTEDKSEKEVQNLKVESLDDLFADDTEKDDGQVKNITVQENNTRPIVDSDFMIEQKQENVKSKSVETEEDTYDLQKELEAKFDELFGPLDD